MELNGQAIWLVIDQLRMFNSERNLIKVENKFLCYFNFNEPTLYFGELFIGNDNKPILFDSEQSAIDYAKSRLINY